MHTYTEQNTKALILTEITSGAPPKHTTEGSSKLKDGWWCSWLPDWWEWGEGGSACPRQDVLLAAWLQPRCTGATGDPAEQVTAMMCRGRGSSYAFLHHVRDFSLQPKSQQTLRAPPSPTAKEGQTAAGLATSCKPTTLQPR